MEIPTIKTLIIYRDLDNIVKILCDFIEEDREYYSVENKILSNNPFEDEYNEEFECHKRDDGSYVLVIYGDSYKPKKSIGAWVKPVLEYKGKIFELKQLDYDKKEYDY